jgi:hypothetical protein
MIQHTRQAGRLARCAPRLIGFVLGVVANAGGLGWAPRAAEIPPRLSQTELVSQVDRIEHWMGLGRRKGDSQQILVLGDSMLLSGKDMKFDQTMPALLGPAIGRTRPEGPPTPAYTLAFPGASYPTWYFFASRIAAMRPDLIIVELNSHALAEHWLGQSWSRTHLVGWLGRERVLEALGLPLQDLGITTDQLAWKVTCIEIGCGPLWRAVHRTQLRVVSLRDWLGVELTRWTGWRARIKFSRAVSIRTMRRENLRVEPGRYNAHGHQIRHGAAGAGMPQDHVAAQLTGATVAFWKSHGIPTLVYVTPINFEHMSKLAVYDASGFATTMRRLEAQVQESGGVFVDLHRLLPDAAFRDAPGHPTFEGDPNGMQNIAERLAPVAKAMLEGAPVEAAAAN